MKNETILVTGAAGFIGFHVTRRLLSDGRDVVGLDNLNAYYDPALKRARLEQLCAFPSFRFEQGDLAHSSRRFPHPHHRGHDAQAAAHGRGL